MNVKKNRRSNDDTINHPCMTCKRKKKTKEKLKYVLVFMFDIETISSGLSTGPSVNTEFLIIQNTFAIVIIFQPLSGVNKTLENIQLLNPPPHTPASDPLLMTVDLADHLVNTQTHIIHFIL